MSPSWGRLQYPIGHAPLLDWGSDVQRGWVVSADYRMLVESFAAIRQSKGVSQRELARRIGKPASFINKIELFERRLDILEFIVLAEALGEHADKLLRLVRSNLDRDIRL